MTRKICVVKVYDSFPVLHRGPDVYVVASSVLPRSPRQTTLSISQVTRTEEDQEPVHLRLVTLSLHPPPPPPSLPTGLQHLRVVPTVRSPTEVRRSADLPRSTSEPVTPRLRDPTGHPRPASSLSSTSSPWSDRDTSQWTSHPVRRVLWFRPLGVVGVDVESGSDPLPLFASVPSSPRTSSRATPSPSLYLVPSTRPGPAGSTTFRRMGLLTDPDQGEANGSVTPLSAVPESLSPSLRSEWCLDPFKNDTVPKE